MDKVLGVDIGGTNIKLGIVTGDGRILEDGLIETEAGRGPAAAAERVARWYRCRLDDHPGICAAGIDCAGLIDGEKGFLYNSPNLSGWDNTPLAAIFSENLALPVTVDNDVNCAAWGEFVMGAGRGTRYFVCVTLGTGVGGGIVIDGRLYRGAQGLAAEIGHQVVMAGGPKCACGNKGCLEALISSAAIVKRFTEMPGSRESVLSGKGTINVRDIAAAAAEGDQPSLRALEETGRIFGIGLANIVHLLNPEVIAVGGGVAGAGDLILEPARISMKEHMMGDILSPVRVVAAELGNNASFIGASLMALGDKNRE